MDLVDRKLLNRIQSDFPLVERPFEELGKSLGISGEEAIGRIHRLKEEKIIRQVSAIFDTRALGYQSSLVAMKVDPQRVDEAAEVVNRHPGVSHNYKRNHAFNIWFTIALPPQSSLERTIGRLHELAGAESTRILPTLRLFKIGVDLDMTGERDPAATGEPVYHDKKRLKLSGLSPLEVQVIRELQEDLPLVSEPFKGMAERLNLTVDGLLQIAKGFIEQGKMRRFAAVLHHRQAGFKANAMGVWKVPEDRVEEEGMKMASFLAVSHCYQRPTYPDWPYNIFTMIHGHKAADCQAVIDAISEATGIKEYAVLYSSKEYKKVRVRYFTEELDQWEEEYLKQEAEPFGLEPQGEAVAR